MKKIVLLLLTYCLMLVCNSCNKGDNFISDLKPEWKGVYFDSTSNEFIHDPRFNYTLIFDELNAIVIPPTEITEEKIIAIKVLNDSEIEITWKLKNETKIVSSMYHYNNQNELVIDKFTYTIAHIPFPNNLASAKFIKEPNINNQ